MVFYFFNKYILIANKHVSCSFYSNYSINAIQMQYEYEIELNSIFVFDLMPNPVGYINHFWSEYWIESDSLFVFLNFWICYKFVTNLEFFKNLSFMNKKKSYVPNPGEHPCSSKIACGQYLDEGHVQDHFEK